MPRFMLVTAAARPHWHHAARIVALLGLGLAAAGCNLDLENPNSPPQNEVLSTPDGAFALAVGMQAQFANSIDDYVVTNSLITDEWGTRSRALVSYISLFTGQNIDNSYLVIESPWDNSYQTIRSANTLLANVGTLGFGPALTNQFTALAKLYKAMAFGMLIQQYQSVPIDISVAGPALQPRAVVLDTVLALLQSARTDLGQVTDADIAASRSRLLGAGFDFRNTVNAMLARYQLMAGNYAEAIAAADSVDPNVLSVLSYPIPERNPIEDLAFQLAYVGALKSFVDEAQPGDQRPAYWVDVSAAPLASNPPDSVILPLKKYSDPVNPEPFPLYLPDEMLLIKAEALTRLGQNAQAATLVNDVRTQTSSSVDQPVAGLPALPASALDTQDELLAEIAYERRYELFEQGLRWEDTRRFGAALTTTPTLEFLPVPRSECVTNPSHPCG
ncbi:MAG TPA: RagB/SusD family nutrient uptake outer membrane protein [Gemmatimonadaceae bacterium]|nr:RagB/SusD family nutrient uptake outer membrane protein [Gemmatimonadaceae bacterium]